MTRPLRAFETALPESMKDPFSGVTVLELGAGKAIAYAGKLMADLGARVVKVESPAGDPLRRAGPFQDDTVDPEGSGAFLYFNASKESVVINIATATGNEALKNWLRSSRIVLYSKTSPSLPELNLSASDIASENPGATVVSIEPFGLDTSFAGVPANDLTLQALGAISLGIGLPGRAPLKLPGDQSAYQAGVTAAIAAASTLAGSVRAKLEVAAADIWATFYNGGEVASDFFGRKKRQRAGYRVSRQPYIRAIFPCGDGYFAIQCTETRHWQAFLRMVEREDLATHPLFMNRVKANDEYAEQCDSYFEPWFRGHSKEEILGLCLENKIPGAPVYDIQEVVHHPHLRERGYFTEVAIGERKRVNAPGHPFKGLVSDKNTARRAPRLGEHKSIPDERPAADSKAGNEQLPLSGIRVVDFGWVWAGAIPGHILADLGAEVIRIESRKPLDFMRQGRPIYGTEKDPEQNPVFQNVNRGKFSLCIDLTKPGAAGLIKELVEKSDVVIENFSPGVMERFGLDWTALRAVRSDLIMCSMSAAGQQGPLRGIRTYAAMIGGLAGLNRLVGYPGERVLGIQAPPYADPNAGMHAAFAILAALYRRRISGEGGYIDLSQWEAAVNLMGEQVLDFGMNGRVPGTIGIKDGARLLQGHFPVIGTDSWIAITISDDVQWTALAEILGNPEWMSAPAFARQPDRLENYDEVVNRLSQETATREGAALVNALVARHIPAAPLLDVGDLLGHSYFKARNLFEMVPHPVLKQVPVYRLPWRINDRAVDITRRAPMLGEHNNHVLRSLLSKTDEQISEIRRSGIID